MKTKANVYLAATDKESNLWITWKQELAYNFSLCKLVGGQHLYITLSQSDLEISKIKEGDYYIIPGFSKIYKCNSKLELLTVIDVAEKIIATTDKLINPLDHKPQKDWYLASIPQSFIEYYIFEYNKGNVIKEVEVELMEKIHNQYSGANAQYEEIKLKINKNNEISIGIPEAMEDLEKQIEEVADLKYTRLSKNPPYCEIKEKAAIRGFIEGAKSQVAKEYWQQRMYTEEEITSFGRFILQASNRVIKINTNMKPLDNDTGEKLLSDMFELWVEQNKKK